MRTYFPTQASGQLSYPWLNAYTVHRASRPKFDFLAGETYLP